MSSHAVHDCNWPFRTQVIIAEQSGSTLSNYQVNIQITGSDFHSLYDWSDDGFDLRIFDEDETSPLEFWIESWDSTTETASLWVLFPDTSPIIGSSNRAIYMLYGNRDAATLANAPLTFLIPGIKFHVRPTSANPGNKNDAFDIFNGIADNGNNSDGYGCDFIEDFDGVSKQSVFGSGDNFAAYSESYFEVPVGESGTWEFRYGADFGRGGALYVNDTVLEEDWNGELWWANSWASEDVLQGSIDLPVGYHKLEVIGFEGCCDGGITVQYKKPGGDWTTFDVNAVDSIDIRSRACPVIEPLVQFQSTEVCDLVDLGIPNATLTIPTAWEINAAQDVSLRLVSRGEDPSSNPETLQLTLPTGFTLQTSSGENWSTCTQVGTLITCDYNASVSPVSFSSYLTLTLLPTSSSSTGSNIIISEIISTYYDTNLNNNVRTNNINVADNGALPSVNPSCSTQTGIWAQFFDITGYTTSNLSDAIDMQTIVSARKTAEYLEGKAILDNINGTANPFFNSAVKLEDNDFLVVFEGYLNVPTTGDYILAVDGDDAIEFWLDNEIRSAFYGLHPAANAPQDPKTIRLAAGYHAIEYRMQEFTGQAVFDLYWQQPSNTSPQIIAGNYFSHCAGNINIDVKSDVDIESDSISAASKAKAIPGAVIKYSVTATNKGNISTDQGTTIITQVIDSDTELFIQDLINGGEEPVTFDDNTSIFGSGLTYQFISINDATDNLFFSTDGGNNYDSPIDVSNNYNPYITHFQIRLPGSLKPAMDGTEPSFTYQYKVRVK